MFEGDIYSLTTYSCPLEKYGTYMLNEIDCYLVLGNENMYISRKDCEAMTELINKEKITNVVMLVNNSITAPEESWPKQFEKERENLEKSKDGVKNLRAVIDHNNYLEIDVFSHKNVSLIFNYILKACILHRKQNGKIVKMIHKIEQNTTGYEV